MALSSCAPTTDQLSTIQTNYCHRHILAHNSYKTAVWHKCLCVTAGFPIDLELSLIGGLLWALLCLLTGQYTFQAKLKAVMAIKPISFIFTKNLYHHKNKPLNLKANVNEHYVDPACICFSVLLASTPAQSCSTQTEQRRFWVWSWGNATWNHFVVEGHLASCLQIASPLILA